MDKFTDDYDFETLTAPAIVTGLPVAIALGMLGFSLNSSLGFSVLGVSGVAFLLVPTAATIRSRGKIAEERIFADGLPTTDMLRASLSGVDKENQFRRDLVSKKSNILLPSFKQARHNPPFERSVIDRAVASLRENMRGSEFKLLRRELKAYGYWRNMYGMRPVGLLFSWGSFAIGVSSFAIVPPGAGVAVWVSRFVSIAALVLWIYFWSFVVNKKNVKCAANNYAIQFFRSLTMIK